MTNLHDWSEYCQSTSYKAITRINLIFCAFTFGNISTLTQLYFAFVRPLLESCTPTWSPHYLKDIDIIENVQRYFTRRLAGYEKKQRNNDNFRARLLEVIVNKIFIVRIKYELSYIFSSYFTNMELINWILNNFRDL